MKNIFILPTLNNKSKLAVFNFDGSKNIKVGELGLQMVNDKGWSNCWSPRELYITSDEEINFGNYGLCKNGSIYKFDKTTTIQCVKMFECKKNHYDDKPRFDY